MYEGDINVICYLSSWIALIDSKNLKDLLCMVQRWGWPSFFLTVTCGEVSDMRWKEIIDLEQVVKSMNNEFTWKDCLVECVVLLHT